MAWSTPYTATTNDTLTATEWNGTMRDNMLEMEVAKATAAPEVSTDPDSGTEIVPGTWFVASAANTIAERRITEGNISKNVTEETTSTTYDDLDTFGPSVTVVTGTQAIVMVTAEISNAIANSLSACDFAVSGATTRAATDTTALIADGYAAGSGDNMQRRAVYTRLALTAGTNVFTMKYRAGSNTAQFRMRQIIVWPI
jgi:hypothetical protein